MAPYMALMQPGATNLRMTLDTAKRNNFAAIVFELNANNLPHEFETQPMADKEHENSYSDLVLRAPEWTSGVIAVVSDDIDCDSNNPEIRKHSEKVLLQDLAMAEYFLSGGYIMFRLKSGNVTNLARIVAGGCKTGNILIQVPAFYPKIHQGTFRSDLDLESLDEEILEDSWNWWNDFRWVVNFDPRYKVVLELNANEVLSEDKLRRWLGEPVDAVIIPSTAFVRNKSNTPVLNPIWRDVISKLIRAQISIIISASANDNYIKEYAEFIQHMKEHTESLVVPGYEDVLEIPLQPLHDNLNCYTYEIFEQDPTKYLLYQNAIKQALIDRVPEDNIKNILTVIMILGAGRGPLIRSALNAAKKSKRKVRIYVIEKNPNAIRTLKNLKSKMWPNEDLRIFSKDMRQFSPPEKADILVSELLGSFGDNELSPECLDCAEKLLKTDGLSIPCKSTSFINPAMSAKLYAAVRNISRPGALGSHKYATDHISRESGFVVLLRNIFHIDFPQPVFEFIHPNKSDIVDNTRYKILKFNVTLDAVLNGVAGYFEAILYKDIILSINPLTHTPNMQSWFPMFFPFTEPICVKKGDIIEIHFWRCVDSYKVWYEWCLVKPVRTHIHNLNGQRSPIYLS